MSGGWVVAVEECQRGARDPFASPGWLIWSGLTRTRDMSTADKVESGDEPAGRRAALRCDLCGAPPTNDPEIFALVLDSSFIHSTDQRFDGQRFLTSCGRVHLATLVERYKRRPFIEEELWAGQVTRAADWLSHLRTPYDLEFLAEVACVTRDELLRAARWTIDQRERQPAAAGASLPGPTKSGAIPGESVRGSGPEVVADVQVLDAFVQVGDLLTDDLEHDAAVGVQLLPAPLGGGVVHGHHVAPAVGEQLPHLDPEGSGSLDAELLVVPQNCGQPLVVAGEGVAAGDVVGDVLGEDLG